MGWDGRAAGLKGCPSGVQVARLSLGYFAFFETDGIFTIIREAERKYRKNYKYEVLLYKGEGMVRDREEAEGEGRVRRERI